ncbi:FKBP-type peptidyl-prolyl cis-trans isomerase [Brachybacterium alimentarium]|uniref:FKBP-type peptidyl-prolyl cis-trans isomerase n=1 Tax=Brachybacterium alimentarium TaxID=47845 RepID=UPI000DF4B66C|nr:FKBP-type peptidyl-prolyl cis-trans isomerase [Brachybacterium alimentarium]RCS74118.1 FKBP-type peptidyl-prolyl cis-trans isomerase [Brachybacterium alimentarium]RCS81759.1 FKBP-type peptidyl-prolyl cis-trans isomerase [Brachybacterium alimentarium]
MIRRRTLLTTALAVSTAIGLAACTDDDTGGGTTSDGGGASDGGGGDPALDAVTISEDVGKEPTVEFDAPLQISAADARIVVPGDGDAIAEGDMVIWRDIYVDASSGDMLQSWWQGGPAGGVQVTAEAIGEEAFAVFSTMTVGSRFAMAGWQTDQSGQARSLVQVGDVDRVVSTLRAKGDPGKPSGDFPEVTLDDDGAPAISGAPEGDAPTKTTREELILGKGDTTREGDFLTMHYTGWKWSDGSQFDSSWERGAPFSFVQGQGKVIAGWDENLLDLAVGSQVMLVVPADEAYGDQGEPADETLIFVIDVLDAAHLAD